MKPWFLYMVRCGNGALYTGITTDVKRRLKEHAGDSKKGAKALRGKGPLRLALKKRIGSLSRALTAEAAVKKFSKAEKERLVAGKKPCMNLLR